MIYSQRFNQYYMDIAKRTAQMSYAKRLQVGAVLVVNNGIIATGYNGMPHGHNNCCEFMLNGNLTTRGEVIHAEQNALNRVVERNLRASDGTMYVTHAPCVQCAIAMKKAFVKRVIYNQEYRDEYGLTFLRENDIDVIKLWE